MLVSRKVLITGIDGFTGIYLERALIEKGYDVFGTVLKNAKGMRHLLCDMRKQEEVTEVIKAIRPDYIFHFAGISFVGEQNRSLIYDVNVVGTEILLKAIGDCNLKPRKVIIPSSATVYGNQNSSILDETMCPHPTNHYGFSKLAVEHLCSSYYSDINILVTRPFNYIGPFQSRNFIIPKIISHYKNREKYIELGNVDVAREFNHVIDVVNIYELLMLSEAKSTVVNICSGTAIELMEIFDILTRYVGYKIEIIVNNELVRRNEIKVLKGSTDRLSRFIDYQFEKNIDSSILELLNSN